MKNQIDIVKDIADGMIGIGGIPSNEDFYAEFDMRVRDALKLTPISPEPPSVPTDEELGQIFENKFDCYTVTSDEHYTKWKMKMAMTKDKFVSVVRGLLTKKEEK